MIARPLHRPRPIPFAPIGLGSGDALPQWATPAIIHPAPAQPNKVTQGPWRAKPAQPPQSPKTPKAPLAAKYLGHGAMRVQSSSTGRLYRFDGHGDRQNVDPRDELMLRRMPDLWVG